MNDCNELIKVTYLRECKARFEMYKREANNWKEIIETQALVGRNGITDNKREGDGKTPKGMYKLGIAFGIHEVVNTHLNYIRINEKLYCIDDVNSKFYNQMVDITKVKPDWNSAEHLIDYPIQYEYAIEIKTNPKNIPGKGSAIFLHCTNGNPTAGCIAIYKENMVKVLKNLSENALINIE